MSSNSDDEFVQAFLQGTISPAQFHHRDHLRLAWCIARQYDLPTSTQLISTGIRTFASQHGHAQKYHETLTRFWILIVAHLVNQRPDITSFATFLATFPYLLEKDLPYHHWRRETMQSATARAQWVEPDVMALPV